MSTQPSPPTTGGGSAPSPPASAVATVIDDAIALAERGPLDIHPKVAVGALVAALATIVLWILAVTGHSLAPEWAALITGVAGTLGGYMTPSSS